MQFLLQIYIYIFGDSCKVSVTEDWPATTEDLFRLKMWLQVIHIFVTMTVVGLEGVALLPPHVPSAFNPFHLLKK